MSDAGYYSTTVSADQSGGAAMSNEQEPTGDAGRYVGVYPVGEGRFSWARIARRGNLPDLVVADSGDNSYASKAGAMEAAERENEGLEIVELDAPPQA